MEKVNYGNIMIKFEDVTIHPHFRTAIPTLGIHLCCHMHHWDTVTQWYEKNNFLISWDGHLFYVNGIEIGRFTEIPYNERFCVRIETLYTHNAVVSGLIITTCASTVPRNPVVRTYDIHEPTGSQVNVRSVI